jgi:hypothetical protein
MELRFRGFYLMRNRLGSAIAVNESTPSKPTKTMIKTTIQLLAATFAVLTIASCTVNVDPVDGSGSSTTTTTTDAPGVFGDRTTTEKTTTYGY